MNATLVEVYNMIPNHILWCTPCLQPWNVACLLLLCLANIQIKKKRKPKTKDWSNQNALPNQCLEVIANTHICE